MNNPRSYASRPRLSCPGWPATLVALVAAAAASVSCTTTHALSRVGDPGVRAEIDAVAAGGDAILHVRHPPGTRMPPFGDRVTAVLPEGFVIEPTRGHPVIVPREQVAYISTYHHARGARDGALGVGGAGLAIGFTLAALLSAVPPSCSDGCGSMSGIDGLAIIEIAAVLGACGAVLGALIGGAGGHEERFELAP